MYFSTYAFATLAVALPFSLAASTKESSIPQGCTLISLVEDEATKNFAYIGVNSTCSPSSPCPGDTFTAKYPLYNPNSYTDEVVGHHLQTAIMTPNSDGIFLSVFSLEGGDIISEGKQGLQDAITGGTGNYTAAGGWVTYHDKNALHYADLVVCNATTAQAIEPANTSPPTPPGCTRITLIEDEATKNFAYLGVNSSCSSSSPCSGDTFTAKYPLHNVSETGSSSYTDEVVGHHLQTAIMTPNSNGIFQSIFSLEGGDIMAQGKQGLQDAITGGTGNYTAAGGWVDYYDMNDYHYADLIVCNATKVAQTKPTKSSSLSPAARTMPQGCTLISLIEDEATKNFAYNEVNGTCSPSRPCPGDIFTAKYPLYNVNQTSPNSYSDEVVGHHLQTAIMTPNSDGIFQSVFSLEGGDIIAQGKQGLQDAITGGTGNYTGAGGWVNYYDKNALHHADLIVCNVGSLPSHPRSPKTSSPSPIVRPTSSPTPAPTRSPTPSPTRSPTRYPTHKPTRSPTRSPTPYPTHPPTRSPTKSPTRSPTRFPTKSPTPSPTRSPTQSPTALPGASYCTYAPDTNCYENGRPACCLEDPASCPKDKPECDVPPGASYCTYSPDPTCYVGGRPSCCLSDSSTCPPKMPDCDVPVGASYCTYAPDTDCYKEGKPACCLSDPTSCPDDKPACDATDAPTGSPKSANGSSRHFLRGWFP